VRCKSNDGVENYGIGRMVGEVFEEALTENSLKGRFTGSDRFVQVSDRAPKKWGRQKQGAIARRLGIIVAKEFRKRRVTKTGRFAIEPRPERAGRLGKSSFWDIRQEGRCQTSSVVGDLLTESTPRPGRYRTQC
jgi:hypothetical protein